MASKKTAPGSGLKKVSSKKGQSGRAISKKTSEINPNKRHSKNKTQELNKINPSGRREESFFELVYEVARQIPYGRVTSYGAIAACLGTKLSARMVGWAMNGADKVNPAVPANVVNRVRLLSENIIQTTGKWKNAEEEGILVKK